MALPLWKAKRILKVGGFSAVLMKEAEEVVDVVSVVEAPEVPEALEGSEVIVEEPVVEAP